MQMQTIVEKARNARTANASLKHTHTHKHPNREAVVRKRAWAARQAIEKARERRTQTREREKEEARDLLISTTAVHQEANKETKGERESACREAAADERRSKTDL